MTIFLTRVHTTRQTKGLTNKLLYHHNVHMSLAYDFFKTLFPKRFHMQI